MGQQCQVVEILIHSVDFIFAADAEAAAAVAEADAALGTARPIASDSSLEQIDEKYGASQNVIDTILGLHAPVLLRRKSEPAEEQAIDLRTKRDSPSLEQVMMDEIEVRHILYSIFNLILFRRKWRPIRPPKNRPQSPLRRARMVSSSQWLPLKKVKLPKQNTTKISSPRRLVLSCMTKIRQGHLKSTKPWS